jgi:hypothetical protein
MDFGMYRDIIDDGIQNGLMSIKLSYRGEPLLHPDIISMVRYAKDAGILDVYLNTNGQILTPRIIDGLCQAGMNRISISIEGHTKEVYERSRGAPFDTIFQNVKDLAMIRDSMGSDMRIRIQTVLPPGNHNLAEYQDYVRFWQPYADEIGYLDLRAETPESPRIPPGQSKWECPFLWQRMTILWDGTVLPCLMHGISDFTPYTLGHVSTNKISDMWHAMEPRREYHLSGRSDMLCHECSFRLSEITKRMGR